MTIQQLVGFALQASILMTVFGFGLRATAADILYLIQRPGLLARSLGAMFVIMPIVAVVLTRVFDLNPTVVVAMIALAISPTPPLLLGKQGKAGGDASYALGLMAIVSLLSIVVVPVGTTLLGRAFGVPLQTPAAAVAQIVLMTTFLPLLVGMGVKAFLPSLADRVAKPIARVAALLLAVGVVAVVAASLPGVIRLLGNGTLLVTAFFAGTGVLVGHFAGGSREERQIVLALSTASRHPAIALTVAGANFPNEPLMGPTVILFLVVGGLVSGSYLAWQRRRAPVAAVV